MKERHGKFRRTVTSRGGVDLPSAVHGSHESSRGLLQTASARDGAQAKRCRPLLATLEIDMSVDTGVGGANQRPNRFRIHTPFDN
jgi:hypothetical protein